MARRRTVPPARTDVEALVYRWGPSIDPDLLGLALTHRSYAHENGGLPTNERLEFLGDSVLGVVVTEHLFRSHPDVPEGQLAKMRAATVSEPALAAAARDLGLGDFIRLGKGETLSGGRDKDSILADTLEALIGATYLTHGLEPTRTVVTRLVSRFLDTARTRGAGLDWKTSLQELCAAHGLGSPSYEVTSHGPDHERSFTARAVVDGQQVGRGGGTSKKAAEHEAAEAAYATILASRGDGGLDLPGVHDALRADLLAGRGAKDDAEDLPDASSPSGDPPVHRPVAQESADLRGGPGRCARA
ncbi:ribonuclease III [Actinomyces sp. 2119]|uniref:ribonuclease III n=1 Tax=Actinomyces sp. 2119 TaxID=2321393 RepID=UPI000E6B99AC|nr:ribonuclease III [Actinomyces sp. 2119]RJF42519.1 ribonuclease III [Actinomyces sp. 2119]